MCIKQLYHKTRQKSASKTDHLNVNYAQIINNRNWIEDGVLINMFYTKCTSLVAEMILEIERVNVLKEG